MKNYKFTMILWIAITLLWLVTTVVQIRNNDAEMWVIIIDVIFLLLSLVNAILNYLNYKKNK